MSLASQLLLFLGSELAPVPATVVLDLMECGRDGMEKSIRLLEYTFCSTSSDKWRVEKLTSR
jgi:hypothetical protein